MSTVSRSRGVIKAGHKAPKCCDHSICIRAEVFVLWVHCGAIGDGGCIYNYNLLLFTVFRVIISCVSDLTTVIVTVIEISLITSGFPRPS